MLAARPANFSGDKASFAHSNTQAGCLAHARRKFFNLHAANESEFAQFTLEQFALVYDIEREVKTLDAEQHKSILQEQTKPVLDALHRWMALE